MYMERGQEFGQKKLNNYSSTATTRITLLTFLLERMLTLLYWVLIQKLLKLKTVFAIRFRTAAVLKYSSNWRAKTQPVFFISLEGHGSPCGEAVKFFKYTLN